MSTDVIGPNGRRLTRKGQQTRERIVATAARIMYERGVGEATLEDVRAAAGVSGSQIYHYFADKQALILAVIEYQTRAVLGAQQSSFARMDTIEGLRAWRDTIVRQHRRMRCIGGCPLGTLGAELAATNPQARIEVSAAFRQWEHAIRAGLRTMHKRDELDADPDDLALALLAALEGGLLLIQVQRRIKPLEVALDSVIDHIESRATTRGPVKPAPNRRAP